MSYLKCCGFCGEPFISTRPSAKFCSDKCRTAASRARHPKPPKPPKPPKLPKDPRPSGEIGGWEAILIQVYGFGGEGPVPAPDCIRFCLGCGIPFLAGGGWRRCAECHQHREKNRHRDRSYDNNKIDCAGGCGARVWKRKDGTAATCQQCRRLKTIVRKTVQCDQCGDQFVSPSVTRVQRFCSVPCAVLGKNYNFAPSLKPRTRSVPSVWTGTTRRRYRRMVTPGLTERQRKRLLHQWIAAGVRCAYCVRPANSIDHVIPLARGGTSYEGNLVPCCKRCNSSKCDLLVTEWRYGKPHSGSFMDREWMALVEPPSRLPGMGRGRRAKPPLEVRTCLPCGATFLQQRRNQRACSSSCSRELFGREVRAKYRVSVGIPAGLDQPTSSWRPLCSDRATAAESPTPLSVRPRNIAAASAEPRQLVLVGEGFP